MKLQVGPLPGRAMLFHEIQRPIGHRIPDMLGGSVERLREFVTGFCPD